MLDYYKELQKNIKLELETAPTCLANPVLIMEYQGSGRFYCSVTDGLLQKNAENSISLSINQALQVAGSNNNELFKSEVDLLAKRAHREFDKQADGDNYFVSYDFGRVIAKEDFDKQNFSSFAMNVPDKPNQLYLPAVHIQNLLDINPSQATQKHLQTLAFKDLATRNAYDEVKESLNNPLTVKASNNQIKLYNNEGYDLTKNIAILLDLNTNNKAEAITAKSIATVIELLSSLIYGDKEAIKINIEYEDSRTKSATNKER